MISYYIQEEKEAVYFAAAQSIRYYKVKKFVSKSTSFELYDESENFVLSAVSENTVSTEFIFTNKRDMHLQKFSYIKADLCNRYCASYIGRLESSFTGKIELELYCIDVHVDINSVYVLNESRTLF